MVALVFLVVLGLAAGFLARAITPGDERWGIAMTIGLGMAGSLVGGFLLSLATDRRVTDLTVTGLFGSVVGAILVLYVAHRFLGERNVGDQA